MKGLVLGVILLVALGIGGLVYRNALEYPSVPTACPVDARICPDGTAVGRSGPACTFLECPPPNVTLRDLGITFAVPEGFSEGALPDGGAVKAYHTVAENLYDADSIVIRRYPITASSTALATIEATAIGVTSGLPVPKTAYTSTQLGPNRVTVVSLERFEAIVTTAFYLARPGEVLRFDAIDRGVTNWTEPGLDVMALPAHRALREMLAHLEG